MIIALLAALTHGAEPTARDQLLQGWLAESAYGDLPTAVARYRDAADRAPEGSEQRADALFHLGEAYWTSGEPTRAREVLAKAQEHPSHRGDCRHLLDQLDLDERSLRSLPDPLSGEPLFSHLVHPWYYEDSGSVDVGEDTGVLWTSIIDRRKVDELWLSMRHLDTPIAAVELVATSISFPVHLRIAVVDVRGHVYALPDAPQLVNTGEDTTFRVDIDALAPQSADAPDHPAGPIDYIALQNATMFYSAVEGSNTVWLKRMTLIP